MRTGNKHYIVIHNMATFVSTLCKLYIFRVETFSGSDSNHGKYITGKKNLFAECMYASITVIIF